MGSTWLIFGGIALGWIAYFATLFMRNNSSSRESAARLSSAATVYRQARTASVVDHDFNPIELSTPLTRRAEIAELRRIDRTAARRRRTVMVVLFGLLVTAAVLAGTGYLPWWSLAIPGGLLVGFCVVARFSVRVLRRQLDERFAAINRGHEEQTIALTRDEADASSSDGAPVRVESPNGRPALWDPLPITRPTYVSKPLAPRTVRTIDLAAPEPAPLSDVPVTADGDPTAGADGAAPDDAALDDAAPEEDAAEDEAVVAATSQVHARTA